VVLLGDMTPHANVDDRFPVRKKHNVSMESKTFFMKKGNKNINMNISIIKK
jgi:hypothetical protein